MPTRRKDKFTKAERSRIMSRIRSKNTTLDLAMKTILQRGKIRFEMYPNMVGKPDFLIHQNLTVFCDSAFWHGRNWKRLKRQLERGSNASYWVKHILKNRRRDRIVNTKLRRLGYTVLRFWDEDIYKRPKPCLKTIIREMRAMPSPDNSAGSPRGSQNR